MYRLLEPKIDTVLETDEFFKDLEWHSCARDPNCGHRYTKFMLPIRRKMIKEMLEALKPIINLDKPVLEIKHADLSSWDDSLYERKCPVCDDGLLLVRRNFNTLVLEEYDMCVACGQRVRYLDISLMQKKESICP